MIKWLYWNIADVCSTRCPVAIKRWYFWRTLERRYRQ